MHPLRVYCIEVSGRCRHRSLTPSTGHDVRDAMRRRQVLVAGPAAVVLLGAGCAHAAPAAMTGLPSATPVAASAAAAAAGVWGRAIAVPGLAALNTGHSADVTSVSCAAPGSCAAGGYYQGHGKHGFVAVEVNRRWRRAIEVPGLTALGKGGSQVSAVSCASPGYCAAGGYYGNHSRNPYEVITGRGFVAVERGGRWHRAVQVPGLGALNKGGNADVSSVSCATRGNCAAGGYYTTDAAWHRQAFVVSETGGSWGTAQEAAGNLNTGGDARVDTVSCGSAGSCAAGGQFSLASGEAQAFVVSEVNGTWAAARAVAGTRSCCGGAVVTSVSCASAGNCAAGGQWDYGGYNAAFLVNEKNGVWGPGIRVPGLNRVARDAYLSSVSCASAGNCAAGGEYGGAGSGVFVVRETNSVWGKQATVPGLGALNKGSSLGVNSVSCASARSCVAGGYYQEAGRYALQGFVTQ